jgi:hypothetical protein
VASGSTGSRRSGPSLSVAADRVVDSGHLVRGLSERAVQLLGRNRPLPVVLAAGALLRIAVAVAYRPAIFYNDSFTYFRQAVNAHGTGLVAFAPDRPAGYPLILKLLGESLAWTTSLQHVAGLVSGVLLYVVMRRLGVGVWGAALAVAVVLLDSYGVTLEQMLLVEAFFTLALTASAALIVCGHKWPALAAGGALLTVACLLRNTGYFLIPAWLVYLGVRHRRNFVPTLAVVGGLVAAFAAYGAWQHSVIGRWTPYSTTSSGWFLYSRIAQFGSCEGLTVPAGAGGLCEYRAADRGQGPEYFLFSGGPARRLFPDEYPGGGPDPVGTNRILRSFAITVIKARPLDYARATVSDFLKFFEPGVAAYGDDIDTIVMMNTGRLTGGGTPGLTESYFYNGLPLPPGHPFAPAGVLMTYQDVFHTPRWFLALCVIAVIATLLLRGLPRRAEQIVLTGGPLLALLGQAATAQFAIRYELPFIGLLIAGGVVAIRDLVVLRQAPA